MDKLMCILVAVVGVQLCCSTPLGDGSRIIGGTPAPHAQIQYAISLQRKSLVSESTRGHECGGALVRYRQAITSASCLYTDTGLKAASEYRVFGGMTLLTDDALADDLWRDVDEFTPHPDYSGPPLYTNDIGVISLVNAFPSNSPTIAPIAISREDPEQRTWCGVAGWGATSIDDQQASVELHHVTRYIVNQVGCTALSDWAGGPVIQSHMLCGGMTQIFTPSCTYDSGNALVCVGALAGVLSWHDPDCSIYHSVEIYTRTAHFYEWLHEIVNKVEEEEEEEDEDAEEEEDEDAEEEEEEGSAESEEEDGDPGAAPPAPALTLTLLAVPTLAHLLYRNSVLNM